MFGGIGARVVGMTPGAAGAASVDRGADGADVVSAPSPATGTPSLVLTQAETRHAARHASSRVVHPRRFINP